jgi:hypothetical protein
MISIKINGQFADLFKGMKIPLKFENPVFSEDFINGAYSYSWNLPLTEKNKRLIKPKNNEIILLFKGIQLFSGYIVDFYDDGKILIINIINDAKKLKEELEFQKLSYLDLEEIEVIPTATAVDVKMGLWAIHINDNLESDPNQGSHKFPMIKTFGYNNFTETESEKQNEMFEFGGRTINRHGLGFFQGNFPVAKTFAGGRMNWITTIAPCPRVEYLLTEIFKKFGFKLRKNQLVAIPEFLQMVLFNNYVLDRLEESNTDSTKYINTFADSYNLSNHVPNNNLYSLFLLLNEVFDAYFVFDNKFVDIFIVKDSLKIKPINLSKYASEIKTNDNSDKTGFVLDYSDEELIKEKIIVSFEDVIGFGTVFQYLYPYLKIDYPSNRSSNKTTSITAIPLITITIGNETGYITNQTDYENYKTSDPQEPWTLLGYAQNEYWARSSSYIKSDVLTPEVEIFEKLYFMCYRGVSEGFLPAFDVDGNYTPDDNTNPNTSKTSNFKNPIWINEETESFDFDTNESFGKSSVYLNGPDNAFDSYKKPKLNLLYNSTIKTKILYFPLFKLLELLKWKEFRHVIQQKKESFIGYAKSYSFVLTDEGISPTECEYIVKNESTGEFNDDFNDDFNIIN